MTEFFMPVMYFEIFTLWTMTIHTNTMGTMGNLDF